jgi:2-polyprenyl-6-methoxyphenol hydroxylase-like FAD-dependent oxidoreductase
VRGGGDLNNNVSHDLSGRTMIMSGHFTRRVVVYPISKRHEANGECLINWVAEVKLADDQPMPPHAWQHQVDVEQAVRHFESFVFDFLDVPTLMRQADAIFQYPMVDRDPLSAWTNGSVTLLGDAAHPLYPGACSIVNICL